MLLFLLLEIVVILLKLISQIFTKGTHCLSTKLYIGRFEKFSPRKVRHLLNEDGGMRSKVFLFRNENEYKSIGTNR